MSPTRSGEGGLSRFSLDRRVTVFVLMLTVLVVGAMAALRIPVELIPSGFTNPTLMVIVPWQNAPAREVLDKVVLPLEEELATVRGQKQIISWSRVGLGRVLLEFKHGTDLAVAYREVRDRIERARNLFPDDIDRVFINKEDASGLPIHVLGIAVDPAITDPYNLVQQHVVRPLQRLDGVASVDTQGIAEKEILIELDREKTAAAGLNIWALAQELSADNFTLASGSVRESGRKLLLRSVARYDSLEALENRLVGPSVRLKDVGRVSHEHPEQDFRVRAMSKPAVAVVVFKEGDANIMEVARAVDATFEELKRQPRLASIEMVTLFSQGQVIGEAHDTLLDSGLLGGVIAAVVLFFFLRRVRLTVILALAIPLSIVIGLTVMYFAGESLNLVTLLGLMICIGMLVDNSVVVAENIHRMHREGAGRREACVRGAGEVGLAITMSTLTTIVVFLPIALIDGPAQFFLIRLAMPVCVSILASLIIALLFIPLCVYLTLPAQAGGAHRPVLQHLHRTGTDVLRRLYELSFGQLNELYGRMLGYFLGRRLDLVLAVSGVFLLTLALPMRSVTITETQDEERSGFHFQVEMPSTMTLEETEQWFLAAEQAVEQRREQLDLAGWIAFHRKTAGEIQGWFKRPRTNDLTPAAATELVREALPRQPGMKLTVGGAREAVDLTDRSSYTLTIGGEDPEQLDRVAADLEAVLMRVPGVLGVKGGNDPPPNELGVVIDRERAQRYQVNPEHVAGVVSTALMGMQLPKYQDEGREVPVRVRFRKADRESLAELANFLVPTLTGEQMPLSAVTDAEFLPAPETIVRRDKRIARAVSFELEEGTERETRERLAALQAGIDLPEGVSFGADVAQHSLNEDQEGVYYALLLSVVFIYLLMGFLFESFILPLSIIFTIPLSIVGVWWAHYAVGRDVDFLGFVAIVLLVGVVVNNGIVLIDYIRRLRADGVARREAVLAATHRRFRPIMMTAITTVAGLIPLALAGANSIGLSYSSFAMTLIGGLTAATTLTLLVIPVLYTMVDDVREAFSIALERALARPAVRERGGLSTRTRSAG